MTLLVFQPRAWAFKPRTHIWVGQQVLNDVIPDGKVTIPPFGEFAVDPAVVEALRAYPEHYRMGHVGPDSFPDVVAGQMTMHPGDGWSSGAWIRHVLSRGAATPATLAFAHGYAGHAAGDTFAHTYVNLYSGDIFVLSDEQGVEVRHFALEDFIARHTPPLIDHTGAPVGIENMNVAAEAIRDILIAEVSGQYTTAAPHLAAMHAYRRAIGDAEINIGGIKLELSTKYLTPQLEILRIQLSVVQTLKDAFEELQRLESGARARLQAIPGELANAQNQVNNLNAQLATLLADAGRALCLGTCEACTGKVTVAGVEIGCDKPECQRGCNAGADGVKGKIAELAALINRLNNEKAKLESEVVSRANQVLDAKAKYEQALSSQALSLAKKAVADVQSVIQSANVVEGLLKLWGQDIDKAMSAYIVMSKDMAIELVKGHGSPLSPFSRWLKCSAPVFAGIPSVVLDAACATQDLFAQFRADYKRFVESLGSIRYVIDPVGQLTEDLKREHQQKVFDLVEAQINRGLVGLFTTLGRDDLAHVVNLLMQGSDGDVLDSHYSEDRSGKGLLIIRDARGRVLADMHVTPAGFFDPATFRPAYDAVLLAKLSLLGRDSILALVQAAGGDVAEVPTTAPFNILADALKSIDGNHQWQVSAPSYFRADGWYPRARQDLKQYATEPLVFWKPSLREKVFLKVFAGPIAENLESPCPLQFPDLVDRNYPYRACGSNPFPDTEAPADPRACDPKLVIDSFKVNDAQPHVVIASSTFNNLGGGVSKGRFKFSICEANCKKERPLLQGALSGGVCAGRRQEQTDTVLLPYLVPGSYDLRFAVTQVGSKETQQQVHRIEVPPCRSMYTVKRGDKLFLLGEKFGMDPWKIAARNRLETLGEIQTGRSLCIP